MTRVQNPSKTSKPDARPTRLGWFKLIYRKKIFISRCSPCTRSHVWWHTPIFARHVQARISKLPKMSRFCWHALYSPHKLYVPVFALLWPFSIDPTFSHATIGWFCTILARFWSHFSIITVSKYEKIRKPKSGHFRQFRNQDMSSKMRTNGHPIAAKICDNSF